MLTKRLQLYRYPTKLSPIMSSRPKQSMSELKLRRLLEHNQRLRDDLARPRIRVSEASASLIRYCKTTKDHLVSLYPQYVRRDIDDDTVRRYLRCGAQ